MKSRILLVGEDPHLLATRALLLSDWATEISSSKDALSALNEKRFDVVIIGQLVDENNVRALIRAAKSLSRPKILVIRYPEDMNTFEADVYPVDVGRSPGWLIEWVSQALEGPHLSKGSLISESRPTLRKCWPE
jgi:hypothetical protein